MAKRAAAQGRKSREPDKRKKGKLASISRERRRRIYLTYRMPELLASLEKLAEETQALTDRLNDNALAQGSPERSKAQERLIYLREYRPVLMKELEVLRNEHRKLAKKAD